MDEWFIDPEYGQGGFSSEPPPCDVWVDIASKLPVGTVELHESTEVSGDIVARIYPDGSGYVAIYKPYWDDDLSQPDDIDFINPNELPFLSSLHKFEQRQDAYRQVEALLRPLRDFKGKNRMIDEFGLTEGSEGSLILQWHDPMITKKVCRNDIVGIPIYGMIVVFGSEASGGKPRYYTEFECDDVAFRAAHHRRQQAYELILKAADAKRAIEAETNEKYPECFEGNLVCKFH